MRTILLKKIDNIEAYKKIQKNARQKGKPPINNNFLLPEAIHRHIREGKLFYTADDNSTLLYIEQPNDYQLFITGNHVKTLPLIDRDKAIRCEFVLRGEQDNSISQILESHGFTLFARNIEMTRTPGPLNRAIKRDPHLTIAPLNIDDIEQVYAIWQDSLDERINPLPEKETIREQLEHYYTIHYKDDIIGGMASTTKGRRSSVEHIAIQPSMRGRGLGSQLIATWVIQNSENNLYLWVEETNRRAIHIYQKCGFEKTGKTSVQYIKEPTA